MKTYLYVSEIFKQQWGAQGLGISVYALDEGSGKLGLIQHYTTDCVVNVSCIDSERGIMYINAEETDQAKRRTVGDKILVLKIDKETGKITEKLGETPTLAQNPVYVALDPTGRYLINVNHTLHTFVHKVYKDENGEWQVKPVFDDSTVVLFSLNADGTIKKAEDIVIHEGSGPLRTQTHAHPHSAVFSPSGNLIAVCDKGADKVFLYRIENGRFRLAGEPYSAIAGDEPRFCAFHPTLPVLYVNHEGNTALSVLGYTEEGELTLLQRIEAGPAVEDRTPGRVYEHQGIAIRPDGKALYSLIRGVDAVVAYGIESKTGLLKVIQTLDMECDWPRCCEISPDGRWLAAGNRKTGDLFLCEAEDDGALKLADRVVHGEGVHYVRFAKL